MSIQRSDSAPRPMVFEHTILGQRVLFGSGKAAEHLAAELDRLGATRPMIIAGEHEAELVRQVAERAQPALTWNDVVQHVPVELAERARDAAREADVDALVTVGGGSTTGLGKAIALTSGLPLLAVPTTYAGSEATSMWGMTEDRTKSTGLDPKVLPEAVIYDAELSRSLPVGLSVASGLNGLAHCVDSLWAPKADPINQAHALEGARALAIALRGIVKDPEDMHAREQALYGCYLSALSFASAGSGIHHKIAHVLGGTFNLPHAETHATVLPYVLAFNAPAVPELAGRLAAALGYEGTVAGGEAGPPRTHWPHCGRTWTHPGRCPTWASPRRTLPRPWSARSRPSRSPTRSRPRPRTSPCCCARPCRGRTPRWSRPRPVTRPTAPRVRSSASAKRNSPNRSWRPSTSPPTSASRRCCAAS
ncbi:iron-containing alcohol dehydrogenase [Kocuria marina]|uniref:maleylacetate reductase n=1 Tax=Kocuria marina TaxID=223184 RepID=UPI0037F904DB